MMDLVNVLPTNTQIALVTCFEDISIISEFILIG